MSQAIRDFEKSYLSTNDLSAAANLYCIVKMDTAADQSVVLAAAATDPIVGVLQNLPKAGKAAVVRHAGTTKVFAGGTITRGDMVTSDASGHAITTTTNKDRMLGIALSSAVASDIVEVLLGGFSKQSL
jgi:Uncharacterized conserved protein (DUF2190)